jgi:hypothetical protein
MAMAMAPGLDPMGSCHLLYSQFSLAYRRKTTAQPRRFKVIDRTSGLDKHRGRHSASLDMQGMISDTRHSATSSCPAHHFTYEDLSTVLGGIGEGAGRPSSAARASPWRLCKL